MNRRWQKENAELRKTLDREREHHRDIPIEELASVAGDMLEERNIGRAQEVLAKIPPVKLGKTTYRVITANRHGMMLVGPRGGTSHLVPSTNNPLMYAHNSVGSGTQAWYLRGPDGTFTKI